MATAVRCRLMLPLASAAVAIVFWAGTAHAVPAQVVSENDRLTVLEVPYLAQAPELCGGAAAAMVLRYWGQRGIWDSDFAHLVDRATRGIRTTDLVAELRQRGATVLRPVGDLAALEAALDRGRPPIVLLEVAPDTYHYVVVVSRPAGAVLYHDPADAPHRLVSDEEFERKWRAAGHWMAVVLPGTIDTQPQPTAVAIERPERDIPARCAVDLRAGVELAQSGDYAGSRSALEVAARACPETSDPWRELAGLSFLEEDWNGAARFAGRAVERDVADNDAWRILATSRYLAGRPEDALDAWNELGEPRIDLVDSPGLERIRYRVVQDRIGLRPGALLTSRDLRLAHRRLDELPAAGASRLSYTPIDGGNADITAAVVVRSGLRLGLPVLIRAGADALAEDRVRLRVASPTGRGELLEGTWRWERHRPRVALSLETPEPAGISGILKLEAEWQVQTYSTNGDALVRETRRRGAATFSRWVAPATRLSAGLALERWSERDLDVVFSTAVEQRLLNDHGAIVAAAAAAVTPGASAGYTSWKVATRWRTSVDSYAPALTAYAGLLGVGAGAPLGVWPGAGTGRGRTALLRAHPLTRDGVLVGEAFGRRLLHGGIEGQLYPMRLAGLPLGVAAFVDSARVSGRARGAASATFVDVGLGLRLGIPGADGDLRLDWARGLRGGGSTVSFGWTRSW